MSAAPHKKEALGKGIRSLLQHIDADFKSPSGTLAEEKLVSATTFERIPIDQIEVNPMQPRRDFDEKALAELAHSIRLHDVIQPITVSRIGHKQYRLIAGERRLRAARMAGLKDIPAYIRQADDQQLLELALTENLQREDLNAIETALSYRRLMEECGLTQEQVAERIGKDRTTVTNYLRLLKLPPDIQIAVRSGEISMGHARAIINIENIEQQLFVFHEIIRKKLSVRQTEELVRQLDRRHKNKPTASGTQLPPAYQRIQDQLTDLFSTRVKLQRNPSGKGHIAIDFYSDEELNRILELLQRIRS
ncbi:ParB/RepB/Spo0J family partition protein [Thermoflavifilum thermophilum]|uniref:Chromosome partitioning protein, ParB family n=1 Tax=Thermoflavifilum thermophilum TaxID=1393122 RepID=A0A1I7NGH3_9BACT|nr:ParB/RepB/Spo0J family partition protein [Thermoflavifilum thermophilum]SFV33693.1 chromosome partitioning protein, ParB family [Thermoflavifilum thermophilum]